MAHLGEVEQHLGEFQAAGTNLLVVTQAQPKMLSLFLSRYPKPYSVVCDPTRAVYRAFGLEETKWSTILLPTVVWGYLKKILRGTRVRLPYEGENVLQLGGDFLLNREGKLLFAFRSRTPTDRPSIAQLLQAIPR